MTPSHGFFCFCLLQGQEGYYYVHHCLTESSVSTTLECPAGKNIVMYQIYASITANPDDPQSCRFFSTEETSCGIVNHGVYYSFFSAACEGRNRCTVNGSQIHREKSNCQGDLFNVIYIEHMCVPNGKYPTLKLLYCILYYAHVYQFKPVTQSGYLNTLCHADVNHPTQVI